MIARDRLSPRGVSLIEMMVVISVLAILFGLCAVTIQILLRVGSDAQAHRTAAAALGRLAEQFREDVHASGDAELRNAGGLRLRLDHQVVIDYEVRDGRVARLETTGGQASRHEAFDLGQRGTAAFERRDDGPRRFLVLVVSHKASAGRPDPPHPEEVLALLGKDRPGGSRSGGGTPR